MAGIFVDHADAGGHLDLVALDPHRLGAVLEKSAERAVGLKADQQHGGLVVPQPALEVMPDAAGVAHAAGGDDDVKAGQLRDRLAFVDGLGEAQMRRVEQAVDVDGRIEACGVLPEHLGRANRQRGIEKDRRGRYFAALHQVDQIDDQFLRAFDGEGRNEQGALGRRGVADLGGQALTALFAA